MSLTLLGKPVSFSDQVLYFQYNDNNGRRNMGLTIADRADVDIYDLVAERDSITKAIPEGPARTAAPRCCRTSSIRTAKSIRPSGSGTSRPRRATR